MASRCFTPFKVPKVRVTLLDDCGTPVESACSSVATDGIITIEQTGEYEERQEFYTKNADGKFCVQRTDPPILKWINLTLTFCNVDPELVYLLTKQSLILNDADTPLAVGNRWQTNDSSLVNFALEAWTRVAAQANCETPLYGYALWPWSVEGTMGEVTYENGAATFIVTSRTAVGSNWGVGPYNVTASEATATLGDPGPLFTPVLSDEHREMFTVTLPPPVALCGCQPIEFPLTVVDPGMGLTADLTVPTVPYGVGGIFPAIIDWGDMTGLQTVTTGTTINHVYGGAGTYTVTMSPLNFSSAPFVGSVVVA